MLYHFARHLRPEQVAARISLTAKRRALVALGRFAPRLLARPGASAVRVPAGLPRPFLPPRLHLVRSGGDGGGEGLVLDLLGEPHPLGVPVDWLPFGTAASHLLKTFHLHYMEYLEAVDDAAFEALVRDWIRGNPPLRPGYWLAGWSSYALSIRAVVWMQQYAARADRLSAAFLQILAGSLHGQIRHLHGNLELDIGGNHLLKNIKTLLWAARFFQGPEANAWARRGEALLQRELAHQVLPDGLHFERSPAYHSQVFADLLECRAVLGPSALRASLDEVLERMAQALADLTHPDGRVSLLNDGGLTMAYPPASLLDAHGAFGLARPGPRPEFALAAAGYFGMRDGADYFVLDCGAVGPDHLPAHAHGDILSFEWTVGGERIVVDPGVFEYAPGPWRAYARSTAAHSTVTLDDADQCEFWSSFRMGRRARVTVHERSAGPGRLRLHGSHDGYRHMAGSPVHHRIFEATPRRIAVEDCIEGGHGQVTRARLLFHPACTVEERDGAVVVRREGVEVRLTASGTVAIDTRWWCPDFGERHMAQRVTIDYGRAPCRGTFLLEAAHMPHHGGDAKAMGSNAYSHR